MEIIDVFFICNDPPHKNSNTRIQCDIPCKFLNAYYKNLNCKLINFSQSESVKDSICFITKFSTKQQVKNLLKNNNQVVYSFTDGFHTNKNTFLEIIDIVDNLIVPCKEFLTTEYCKNKYCYLIQHISDMNFNVLKRNFKVGYFGNKSYAEIFNNLGLKDFIDIKIYDWHNPQKGIMNGMEYPVHVSLRDMSLKFKPATKITCARNFNSLLLCTKDYCFRDMLGEDWPLYVDLNKEQIIDKINYLKDIYMSKTWFDLVDKFMQLTEDCSPETVCLKYYNIITTLKEKK